MLHYQIVYKLNCSFTCVNNIHFLEKIIQIKIFKKKIILYTLEVLELNNYNK